MEVYGLAFKVLFVVPLPLFQAFLQTEGVAKREIVDIFLSVSTGEVEGHTETLWAFPCLHGFRDAPPPLLGLGKDPEDRLESRPVEAALVIHVLDRESEGFTLGHACHAEVEPCPIVAFRRVGHAVLRQIDAVGIGSDLHAPGHVARVEFR